MQPEHRRTFRALITFFAVFLAAAGAVHFFWPQFDADATAFIQKDRGLPFANAMAFISFWGHSYMMVVPVFLASAVFFLASMKKEALFTLGVFLADAVNVVFKLLVDRSRPHEMDVFPKFQQGSFPSGHVVHYVVFFGFLLIVLNRRQEIPRPIRIGLGALCLFLMAGVAFSRVHAGEHWPSDILVAYAEGFLLLALLDLGYKRA